MKVLLSWLREFCPTSLPPTELAERLVSQGVQIEALRRPWEGLSGVVVARVLDVADHPRSEKLCVAKVDSGVGERQLVVGVRNMKPGDLVPFAPEGASVPILPEPLTARQIRGVVSEGMLCSARELGVSPDHGGILILPDDLSPGEEFKAVFGLDDTLFDIEIEPNRPDLMSVVGVAREASAATGDPLLEPEVHLPEAPDQKAHDHVSVEILDGERCRSYVARLVAGVSVAPSPIVVQARLSAAGMRPVSNVVDATNYVMVETGQPLHPFDLHLVEDGAIVVRRARDGERLVTLDGVDRTLSSDDLLIADNRKGIGLAGVMGASASEVSGATRDVLIESAYFERRGISRTARRHTLQTEASMRFERGTDPEGLGTAAERAASLMATWAGGTVLAGAVQEGEIPPRRLVDIRPARASAVLGSPVSSKDVHDAFTRLRIRSLDAPAAVRIEVPGYRVDLEREVDLIEEVARMRGYDRITRRLPAARQGGGMAPSYSLRRRLRHILAGAGLREVMSFSFMSESDQELLAIPAVAVANPVSADERLLRTSLMPGLLRALRHNAAHHVRGAALFEVGRVFRSADPLEEGERVAYAMFGSARSGFPGEERSVDLFDAKGVSEVLMRALGVTSWALEGAAPMPFHPGRSGLVVVSGEPAGALGELHPGVAERFHLPGRVALSELDVAVLARNADPDVTFREIPRFPPVLRDLAFVVDLDVPAARVHDAIVDAAAGLVDSVALFDVFTGEPVPSGRKSLAFSVDFRAPDRTLTTQEVDAAVEAVARRVADDLGGELRTA